MSASLARCRHLLEEASGFVTEHRLMVFIAVMVTVNALLLLFDVQISISSALP